MPLRSPPRRIAARPLVPARRSGPTAKASCSRVALPVTSPAAAGRRSTDRRHHAGSAPVYGGAARSRSAADVGRRCFARGRPTGRWLAGCSPSSPRRQRAALRRCRSLPIGVEAGRRRRLAGGPSTAGNRAPMPAAGASPVAGPPAVGWRDAARRRHAGGELLCGSVARSRSAPRPGGGGVSLAASRSVRSPAVPGRQFLRRDPIRRRNVLSLPHPKLPLLPAHTRAEAQPTILSRPVTIHLKVLCFPCRNQQSLTCTRVAMSERNGASRRWDAESGASALPLTTHIFSLDDALARVQGTDADI